MADAKKNGSIISQSSSVSGTVSKNGWRKGTYTTIRTSSSEALTAQTIQRFENAPIEKIEWYSERAVKAQVEALCARFPIYPAK